ncbi:MAG: GerMN domain-containing protein [Nocardioidaceae bacterium]|nr:GerMN domain-containing protein [Nocardioidaceae bacterium]
MTARARVLAALAVAALACGCSTLPTSGTVHTRPDTQAGAGEAPYFAPPGPTAGNSREGVVRGFLLAMQANPPSTAVAREFLSTPARNVWKPGNGTIVYDASAVTPAGDVVEARLGGAHRLDPRGAWDVRPTPSTATIRFSMVRENGEWRISNPPNVLAVPASYFSSLFVPFDLYFFDHTGSVLVPTRVYLSRGQTTTNLVKGLLAGPPPNLADAVTSAVPPGTALDDLAVVVNGSGVAEVPLGPGVLTLSPAQLNRLSVQLAWTLGQVPGVNRIRLVVDGATVPLPDGQTDIRVGVDSSFDPVLMPDRSPVVVAGGRVVRIDGGEATPVGGPLGAKGFSLRSVALNARAHRLVAVSGNGRQVYLAPDQGARTPSRVRDVLDGGADVLAPAFDRFGMLWLVDRTARGAVVRVVDSDGRVRALPVPGITGRNVGAFTLTRDGTRLVATTAGPGTPTLLVSAIVRGTGGRVARVLPADRVEVSGAEPGPVVDVGQVGATTVALLTQPSRGPGRVSIAELDGSPGDPATSGPTLVPTEVEALGIGPLPELVPLVVTADHRLLRLGSSGRWDEIPLAAVTAVAYPQ